MTAYIAVLDVGHGNAAVVKDSHGTVILDAGPGSALLEFLQEQNIRRVDSVLISHADEDHIAGLISVIESRTVEIGLVRVNTDSAKGTQIWDDLLYLLSQKSTEIHFEVSLTQANSGEFGCKEFFFEILAPNSYVAGKGPGSTDRKGRRLTSNSISAVIRILKEDKPTVLFAGDLDVTGVANLFEAGIPLCAPVLVFPHHGGRLGRGHSEEYVRQFCEQTRPSIVVFSIGRGKHGNPREDTVRGIRQFSPEARILCTQLSERCAYDAPRIEMHHLTPDFARGRLKNHCCAGTIRIVPTPTGVTVEPDKTHHQSFIVEHAPTALCRVPR